VNIGLIPGAGGTQRLPRLSGVQQAVEVACSGTMFSAEKMQSMGALDLIVDDLDSGVAGFIAALPPRPVIISQRKAASPGS
jgi:3-hydroxyacyl-CoA dehydrogenase